MEPKRKSRRLNLQGCLDTAIPNELQWIPRKRKESDKPKVKVHPKFVRKCNGPRKEYRKRGQGKKSRTSARLKQQQDMSDEPNEPSQQKSIRKIIVVDNFDHIPGLDESTIGGNHVRIVGDRLSITGWRFPWPKPQSKSSRRQSVEEDGISHYLPKGARIFLPTEDIKNLENADDSSPQNPKHNPTNNANVYLYDDSIWAIDPDEPLLEETSYQYDRSRRIFLTFFLISIILGALILLCFYAWVFEYGGGVLLNSSISNATARQTDKMKKYYNIHAVIIMTSVFTLHFENILIFRVFPHVSKFRLKCIHATTAFIGAVGLIVALLFSIWGHGVKGEASFTSLHGCIGVMTMGLYEFQFLLGFLTFLLPYASLRLRAQFVPIHKFFGGMTFLCGTSSVVTGVVVIIKVFIPLQKHSKLPLQSIMLNAAGVLTVLFTMLITFLITDRHFRRRPRPELHLAMEGAKQRRKRVDDNLQEDEGGSHPIGDGAVLNLETGATTLIEGNRD